MIERHHLEIISAVHQEGTVTAAAERLCLTQSALSHSIRRLEHLLDGPIWHKHGRHLHFTPLGQYLLNAANRLIRQMEELDNRARQIAAGGEGAMKIGMECHPCYMWMLPVLDQFLDRWPKIDVDVKQQFQFGAMGALLNYDIDVMITPDATQQKGVIFLPIFEYELVLVTSKTHPLAKKSSIRPEDLSEQTLFTYPVSKDRLDIFNLFLLPANLYPRQHKHIEITDVMLQLISANRGVSALPKWLIKDDLEEKKLASIPLGTGVYKTLYLAIREHDKETSYIQDFMALAQAHH